jgi:hypothetical protein
MNPKAFQEYKLFLDNLSQEEFSRIKAMTLASRVRFNDLGVGEIVCPLAEDVRDRKDCVSSCSLKSFCPNFVGD